MSPSVIIPSNLPLISPFSEMQTAPIFFLVKVIITVSIGSFSPITGNSSPMCIKSDTCNKSLFPRLPPGWYFAKSFFVKFLSFIRLAAIASPMTSVAVVELVGAWPIGHASLSTPIFTTTSECFASVELLFPVRLTIFAPIFFIGSKMLKTSSEFPLFEIAMTISPQLIIPKSPWSASAEFTKMALVPVEAKVAAIFSPIIPDFPIPVITTLFFPKLKIIFTSFSKFSSTLFLTFFNSSISISKTFFPSSITLTTSILFLLLFSISLKLP